MGILRLTISCFTGLGVLVLLVTLLAVAWLVVTLRRLEREKPPQTGPLAVDWEAILEEVQK